MRLPTWMRRALFATAVMNAGAAILFLPPAGALRELAGLPPAEHPIYLATVSMFVLLFGLGYLWAAGTGRADRLFLTIAAAGKLAFVTLVTGFWAAGGLPFRAPVLAAGDLLFAALFLTYLFGARPGHTS